MVARVIRTAERLNFFTERMGIGKELLGVLINADGWVWGIGNYFFNQETLTGKSTGYCLYVSGFFVTYHIPGYAKRKDQLEEDIITDEYKIGNKNIKVIAVANMNLRIISSTPELYYWELPKILIVE